MDAAGASQGLSAGPHSTTRPVRAFANPVLCQTPRLFADHRWADRFERWSEVPVLTRDDATAYCEEMRAHDLPATFGNITDHKTSGSNGASLSFTVNSLAKFAYNGALTRLAHWHGADPRESSRKSEFIVRMSCRNIRKARPVKRGPSPLPIRMCSDWTCERRSMIKSNGFCGTRLPI